MGFLAGKRLLITGRAVEPLDRLRHRPRLPPRGRRTGLQLRQGERFKDRITEFAAEFGSRAGLRLRRRPTTPRSTRMFDAAGRRPGRSSTASCTRSASRRARRSPATSSTACRARPSASPTTSRPTASRRWPRPRCRGCAPAAALLTLTYLGAERARAQLQHHGPGQGLAGSQRALPGGQPGAQGHPRQRHLGRADQDAGRLGHQGLRQAARAWSPRPRRCAATSRSTMSATSPPSCCPTWRPASPPRSPTSTAASARWPAPWTCRPSAGHAQRNARVTAPAPARRCRPRQALSPPGARSRRSSAAAPSAPSSSTRPCTSVSKPGNAALNCAREAQVVDDLAG